MFQRQKMPAQNEMIAAESHGTLPFTKSRQSMQLTPSLCARLRAAASLITSGQRATFGKRYRRCLAGEEYTRRLHSAIGYVTPHDRLAGRHTPIWGRTRP